MLKDMILQHFKETYEMYVEMYGKHIEYCETCKKNEKCEDEMISIEIIESIQLPYYKYVIK